MAYEIYVDNIDRDEMRSGFLVTSNRKKLWNVQLNLVAEFARICKKHNLKWYAYGGTALGAARHGGYIPWDDDIDLAMMRPEYEKFKRVVSKELNPLYSVDMLSNYAIEGDFNPENFPVITRKQFKENPWMPMPTMLRLRDNRTMFLRYPEFDNLIQGIWIDVIPLDPVPPFDSAEHEKIFDIGYEYNLALIYPEHVARLMERGEDFRLPYARLKELLKMPFWARSIEYEKYLAENFFESKHVCFLTFRTRPEGPVRRYFVLTSKNFSGESVDLPFEKLTVPAPLDYDQYLRERYGDWRKLVFTHSHAHIYSADVSYKEYFAERAKYLCEDISK